MNLFYLIISSEIETFRKDNIITWNTTVSVLVKKSINSIYFLVYFYFGYTIYFISYNYFCFN